MAKPGQLLMNQTQRLDIFASKGEVVGFEILSYVPEATLISLSVVCCIFNFSINTVMIYYYLYYHYFFVFRISYFIFLNHF